MTPPARPASRRAAHLAALGAAVALSVAVAAGASTAASPSAVPTQSLTVGLGYIDSVQFAPFYLADSAGYYRDAGLTVTFHNQNDPDLIILVGQGAVDIGLGDGTSVIPAVSQGIRVRYAATIYATFPSVVFSKTERGISEPADLAGRTLGTPGQYGSSWIMLQALLDSAGLTPDDLTIEPYPEYTQGAAVAIDEVDAATGFINNEPVVLTRQGYAMTLLQVDDIVPLPGPGLVVGESTLAAKHDALAAFVAQTLRAMADITADPALGLDASIPHVPAMADDPETQAAVLAATIDAWSSPFTDAAGLGAIDAAGWAQSVEFLSGLQPSPVAAPVTVDQLITTELLPVAP